MRKNQRLPHQVRSRIEALEFGKMTVQIARKSARRKPRVRLKKKVDLQVGAAVVEKIEVQNSQEDSENPAKNS